jgi:VIT1/CCC1 family predicted Fe2+/Mn2+ transporter
LLYGSAKPAAAVDFHAGVLGANDGLVSVASLMMGVGGGTQDVRTLVLSGLSGLVGGALSMAGESCTLVTDVRKTKLSGLGSAYQ